MIAGAAAEPATSPDGEHGAMPVAARKRRAPNLDGLRAGRIVQVVGRMVGDPTWDAVVAAVEAGTGDRYTRQALFANDAIRLAVRARLRPFGGTPPLRARSAALQRALERIAAMRAERRIIQRRDDAIKMKLMTWAYNAANAGMTEEELERPIPGQ